MAIASELVTVLRYSLDKSGLSEYLGKAKAAARQLSGINAAATEGLRQGLRDASRELDKTPRQVRQIIREQVNLNRAQKQSARNVKAVGDGYRRIISYLRTALGVGGVIGAVRIADEWSGVEARIGAATDSIHEQQRAMRELFAMSQRSGSDFLAGGDLFISISRNREQMGLLLDDSLQLTDTIAKLTAMGGGSSSGQQAALVQLGQAMGLGVLRGQDLKSVQSQAPRLAQGIAEAFGVSVGELSKLGEQGKLTAKEMADGLLRISEKVNEEFERMPKTFGQGATLIRNELGRIIWQQDRATAASQSFYAVTKLIAENLTHILKLGAMLLLTGGALKLASILKGIVASVMLLGSRFMMVATRVGIVRAAALFLARAGRSMLWPFLSMYAVLETIRLVGQDILTWLRGGRSVLGGLIGRSEEWQDQINAIKRPLAAIRDMLGTVSGRWITIGTLALGVGVILKTLLSPVAVLGKAIMTKLVIPLTALFFATFGWPGLVAAALVAIVALVIAKFDVIRDFINGIWDSVVNYFKDKWEAAIAWVADRLKAIMPDKWVLTPEEGSALRRERGESDPRLRYRQNMGLLQRPNGGRQQITNSGNVVNNVTVTAPSGSAASVARTTSQAVRRVTPPRTFASPNVEALP